MKLKISRVYQDKLASLKKQLQQLKDGTHPEYNRKLKRLETQYKERFIFFAIRFVLNIIIISCSYIIFLLQLNYLFTDYD